MTLEPTWSAGDVELYLGDCLEILPQLEAGSVDAVVTDPPYKREYITLYSPVFNACNSVMSDTSICISMVGQTYLPEVINSFPASWSYIWQAAYMVSGARVPIWPRGISAGWKPLLIYGKGITGFTPWIMDVINPQNGWKDAQLFHKWGQDVGGFAIILSRFTIPNNLILDPFMGSGTTGVACVQTGRKFIGIEIDEKYFGIAVKRISEAQLQMRLPI